MAWPARREAKDHEDGEFAAPDLAAEAAEQVRRVGKRQGNRQCGGRDLGGLLAPPGREPGDAPAESVGIGEGDEDRELVGLAHHDEAGKVLVREPEEAAGRALVSEGEEVSGDTRGEHSQAVAPVCRVAQQCDVTDRDDQQQGREHSGPAGEEVFRLGRPRAKEAVEPGDVHQQPDSRISPGAIGGELGERSRRG